MIYNIPAFPLNSRKVLICLLIMTSPLALGETQLKAASEANEVTTTKKNTTTVKNTPVKNDTKVLPELTITKKVVLNAKETYKLPVTTESITSEHIENTINAMTAEDVIKYMPSIQVRRRYIGDTNAPVGWRTSGTSASARGLIYADGILLSSLLGNNNGNTGSPRWNMVSPSEIDRTDVMYGPFSAAYSGNSMGGVIDIKTKMPQKFEAGADIKSTWQDYGFYGKKKTYDSQEYSFNVGDRYKDFSFRFDVSHLDSNSQPITFNNPILSTVPALAANTIVTGAIANANPYGKAALVLGAGNINHTVQDNFKWKFGYDITNTIHAAYTLGLWQNDNHAGFESYLRDSTGNIVNSGVVNIAGKQYNLGSV
jgi:iron complex outermembrane receptor protein